MEKKMKPIWFFVGLTLLVIGSVILAAGIFLLISPPEKKTVLFHLHPDLWWGATMIVSGIAFLVFGGKAGENDHE